MDMELDMDRSEGRDQKDVEVDEVVKLLVQVRNG